MLESNQFHLGVCKLYLVVTLFLCKWRIKCTQLFIYEELHVACHHVSIFCTVIPHKHIEYVVFWSSVNPQYIFFHCSSAFISKICFTLFHGVLYMYIHFKIWHNNTDINYFEVLLTLTCRVQKILHVSLITTFMISASK